MSPNALFLHMGPGGNSYVERKRFQSEFPHIDFWDQPRTSGPKAYSELIQACCTKIENLSQNGRKIDLIAHSFGAHLTCEVLARIPERVGRVLIVAPVSDPSDGFQRLLSVASRDHKLDPNLRQGIDAYLKLPVAARQDFQALIGQVLKVPDFMSYYWHSSSLYREFAEAALKAPPFDLQQFLDVSIEFISRPKPASSKTADRCSILFGVHDPLIKFDLETNIWSAIFPNSNTTLLKDVGHLLHLECPDFRRFLRDFLKR